MSEEFNPYEFREPAPDYSRRVESEVVRLPSSDDEVGDDSFDEYDPLEERPLSEEERLSIEEEQRKEAEREARRIKREANPFWQFISGNWLINEGVADAYRYLIIIALLLFFSVVSIFYSLHLDAKYARKVNNVQLLRERSLEYQSVKFDKTSHSAIVKELERRNIELYELPQSKIVIED